MELISEKKNIKSSIQNIQARIKLSNKLLSARSIKQFLTILYQATNPIFKVKSFLLCWHSGHFGAFQYIYSKNFDHKRKPVSLWPPSLYFEFGNENIRQYLANELGHPVQYILTIPITLKKYSVDQRAILFIEYFNPYSTQMKQWYETILNPITMSLDHLLLQDHLQTGSKLLSSTFDYLKEPLAILDQNHQINRSNKMFDQCSNLLQNNLSQKILHWNNCIYEQHRYSAHIKEAIYTIYHYVNVTKSFSLRSQMIQNEKMAALGKLGEEIAHELNNPLTGILSMAQLYLQSKELPEDIRTDIKTIASAAYRSQKIISHFLKFTNSNSKKIYTCNLNTAVKNTLSFVKSITHTVNIQIQMQPEPIFVTAQLHLLQQVIFNLIKNSCQAAREQWLKKSTNQATVKVCIGKKDSLAYVSVEDNGPGIKAENYDKIFKPFFTTKSKNQGTGLGLNISMHIVKNFKGKLTPSRSALGGACFKLELPIKYP